MSISLVLLRTAIITTMLTASAATLQSQITLDARQGSAWSNEVTLASLDSLRLRWRWVGAPNVTRARWQISYTSPASTTQPPLSKNVSTTPPPEHRYQYLTITAADLPSNVPSTFFMRISGPNRNSNWVTIKLRPGSVAQGRRERNTPQRGEPEQRKAQPERANPGAAGTGALKKDPFVIPGGGAKTGTLTVVDMTNTPLWMRLTHMRCFAPQIEEDDDTAVDVQDVYAIVVTVRPNRNNLGQSAISASASKIFTITRCGHADNNPRIVFPNTPAWGPNNGAPVPIRVPYTGGEQNPDAIVFVALLERDSDGMSIPLMLELIRGKIRSELTTPLVFTIGGRIRSALKPDPTSAKGDDLIGLAAVKVSEDELRRAQQGEVVRLNIEVKPGGAGAGSFGTQPSALNSGSWTVELQLGREGVEMQGLQLALCNDGTQWYGWALIGVCAGRGGVKAPFSKNWELLKSPN